MLMVRENTHGRIERAGVSDARKARFDPLAKQAGEKCALCVITDEAVRLEHGRRHGTASTVVGK